MIEVAVVASPLVVVTAVVAWSLVVVPVVVKSVAVDNKVVIETAVDPVVDVCDVDDSDVDDSDVDDPLACPVFVVSDCGAKQKYMERRLLNQSCD